MTIETTSVAQTANAVLGTPEKKLFYLIIKNSKGTRMIVNVGEKTHNQVNQLVDEEKGVTKLQFEEPIKGLQQAAAEGEANAKKGGKL